MKDVDSFQNIKEKRHIQTNVPFMAERMGFEPMWLLAKRFSRPPRYDRFDTSPYLLEYNITGNNSCQVFFIKNKSCLSAAFNYLFS